MINKPTSSRRCVFSILRSAALVMALIFNLVPSVQASDALNTMKRLDRTSPNTMIERLDGSKSPFSDLADRPILVNFWASWCAPCVHELPDLAILDQSLSMNGMAVVLVGIDNKGREFAETVLAKRGITIPSRVYEPSRMLAPELEIKVMPTSFLILPGGRIIGKIEGPLEWSSPEVIAAVKSALKP
jgi:thiol-disulfide isomerase/thioredoxin